MSSTVHNVALEEEIGTAIRFALERLSLSSLAHISEGYSAGAIARTVRIIVTPRRVGKSLLLSALSYTCAKPLTEKKCPNSDDAHSPVVEP